MEKLQQLFSDSLAVRRQDLETLMALLLPSIVKGNVKSAAKVMGKQQCSIKAATPNLAKWYELDDLTLPVDSIAVINLQGFLFSWDCDWLMCQLEAAEANPNVCGVVLVIDGPGGMVSHVDQAVAAIEKFSKPTATVVTGCMASAHFWLGTSTDRTFIATPLCEVGSVGILCEHYNFAEYFRQNGIDYRVIYPDTADLKNKEVRAIDENNDEQPMKSRLEKLHRAFADAVARHLNIEYDPQLPLFRGEMFYGDEAVAMGYIDEMGALPEAVKWVLAQSTIEKVNSLY